MTLTFDKPPVPGINYTHPANKNIQFSYVASPGFSAFDLVKQQFGTKTGSPTLTNNKIIGQTLHFRSLTNDVFSFASRRTLSTPATIAVIAILNSTAGGSRTYFQNSSAAGGICLDNQSSGSIQLVARNIAVLNPTIAVSTGIPYLMVFSMAPNFTVNAMVARLDTGAFTTGTSTNISGPSAGNGTFLLGNLDLAAQSGDADIAAVLFSNTVLSLSTMKTWAQDPWGPWRPNSGMPHTLMMSAANNDIVGERAMSAFTQSAALAAVFVQIADVTVEALVSEPSSLLVGDLLVEALIQGPATLGVGQLPVEVLFSGTPSLQVGQIAIEVLKSATPYYFPISPVKNKSYRRR